MTAITSSAASETERARNWTPGRSGATWAITAWPPPSGRWTSSRTTSGSARGSAAPPRRRARLADDLDRVAELAAHAGAEEVVVVDDHDAASRASSAASARPRCPRPGARDPRRAAGAGHPASIDSGEPAPVGGTASGRSRRRGRGRRRCAVVADLRRRRRPRRRRRTWPRSPSPRGQRARARRRRRRAGVAGGDDLDPDAVQLLDLGRRRLDRGGEGSRSRARASR